MRQKKSGFSNLVLITQLGINVMTPIFLCILIGSWIDKKFGTGTILIFLVLGVLSGGLSAYRTAKNTVDSEKKELDREKEAQVKEWESRYGTVDSEKAGKSGEEKEEVKHEREDEKTSAGNERGRRNS